MAFEHLDQFGQVLVEQIGGFELMASQEHVPPEREPAPPASRLDIVGNKDGPLIIGVGSDIVIVGATKSSIDNAPTFMALVT